MEKRTSRLVNSSAVAWALIFFIGAGFRVLADCLTFGLPFNDLGSTGFCAAIAEAYYTGITNGTSATTFSPNANVTRAQAAAFATRTLDAALVRGSRRAALGQWWTTAPWSAGLAITDLGGPVERVVSDGDDVWALVGDDAVIRVHGRDGRILGTWTGAENHVGILAAFGRIFVTGSDVDQPKLYMLDPAQSPGVVTTVVSASAGQYTSITTDGSRLFMIGGTAIWIVNPVDWSVTQGPMSDLPSGLVFDGSNLWFTETTGGHLLKLDSTLGSILAEVPVTGLGETAADPLFDGSNIWVLGYTDNSITIVRARDGIVVRRLLATDGIPLDHPHLAAFDGRRVVVTSDGFATMFNASDLTLVGTVISAGIDGPVCNDGIDFWLGLAPNFLGRL